MAEAIFYKEFHTLRWLTWILGAVSVLVLFYAIIEDAPAGGWLVLTAFVGFFVSQFLAAVHRVNRITLTESQLRVGKETFEIGLRLPIRCTAFARALPTRGRLGRRGVAGPP